MCQPILSFGSGIGRLPRGEINKRKLRVSGLPRVALWTISGSATSAITGAGSTTASRHAREPALLSESAPRRAERNSDRLGPCACVQAQSESGVNVARPPACIERGLLTGSTGTTTNSADWDAEPLDSGRPHETPGMSPRLPLARHRAHPAARRFPCEGALRPRVALRASCATPRRRQH
jgi:hypothetical protein